MQRRCGDFRLVELENVKESEMQEKESFQKSYRPEGVLEAALGRGVFQWLL